jgi:hypothetical protein
MKDWNNFFGSKLNSVLLLILIILMSLALRVMYKNPAVYIDPLLGKNTEEKKQDPEKIDTNMMTGHTEDLLSFSVAPGTKMPKGILSYRGELKGAWFFEGNILINILDSSKNLIKSSNAVAKTEWMTAGPVSFEGNIDFTGLPAGMGYFQIHNDNASGLPEKDKSILIPIILQ